jgi:O-antigen/teichoic acid export membrane protein
MIGGIIVARIAGPTIIGTVAFGMSFVTMFTFICELGISSAHIKLVSEGRKLGDCIKTFGVMKLVLIIVFIMVVLGYLLIQKFIFRMKFTDPTHIYVIILWLVTSTITQFLYIPTNTFMALTQQAKQDIPNIIQSMITLVLRVVFVIFAASAVSLSFANLFGILAIIPFYIYLFRGYPIGRFDRQLARDYYKIARALALIDVFVIITSQLDKVLLQYFSDSTQVGYYSAGFSIAGLIQYISLSAGVLFFPIFSAAVAQKDYGHIDQMIEKYERFVYLFILPAVVILMIYSNQIIVFLLGSKYQPSSHVLFMALLGAFFIVANQHYGNLLVGAGFYRQCAYVNFYGLVSFCAFNMIFVGSRFLNLKAFGTSVAYTCNALVLGLLFRVFTAQSVRNVPVWRNRKFWLFGIVNFILFYTIARQFRIEQKLIMLIAFPFIYFVVTYGVLFLLRLMRKDDLLMLRKMLNVRLMADYIRTELKI